MKLTEVATNRIATIKVDPNLSNGGCDSSQLIFDWCQCKDLAMRTTKNLGRLKLHGMCPNLPSKQVRYFGYVESTTKGQMVTSNLTIVCLTQSDLLKLMECFIKKEVTKSRQGLKPSLDIP